MALQLSCMTVCAWSPFPPTLPLPSAGHSPQLLCAKQRTFYSFSPLLFLNKLLFKKWNQKAFVSMNCNWGEFVLHQTVSELGMDRKGL